MIQIREMRIDDLDQVMVIEKENFSVPWTENGFFTLLIRQDMLFLVAEEEGRILGYAGMILIPDEGEITNVSVAATARRRGIGRELLRVLFEKAKAAGIRFVYLEVRVSNEAAIRLYKQYGFVKEGIRRNYYEEPTEDAMVMSGLLK